MHLLLRANGLLKMQVNSQTPMYSLEITWKYIYIYIYNYISALNFSFLLVVIKIEAMKVSRGKKNQLPLLLLLEVF